MTFSNPLPWWGLVLVSIGAALVAWLTYRRAAGGRLTRGLLMALRCTTLLLLVVFLMRPVRVLEDGVKDAVVPILVDVSRSMGIPDAGGAARIARAREILSRDLVPSLGRVFRVDVLAFGEHLRPASEAGLAATDRRSDVSQALATVVERYRGRFVPGIILLSDGGDTSAASVPLPSGSTPPVFAMGFGAESLLHDREIVSLTAGEAALDGSRVELAVSAVSHDAGPLTLRLLENGRPVEVRAVTSAAPGVPVHEVFQVSPPRDAPTVYTVEVPVAGGELVPENNARSTLVQPPSRVRRVLFVEGAPGFEHSFLKRAWAADAGLSIDSIVRKGENDEGTDTFYIQAPGARAAALASGYPQRLEDLFSYDAIVLANVEAGQLTGAELDATRTFVARRGGGLLVLGARSLGRRGLADTVVEPALPLELSDRAGVIPPATSPRGLNLLALTAAGESHPVMQLGSTREDTRKKWSAVPALAAVVPLGRPRPGATVLAIAAGAGGSSRAVIAVQRYGEGRVLLFAGEAAWRWRMLLPASDRSYDTFWRQTVRWLALPASDPVALTVPAGASAGTSSPLKVLVRSAAFESRAGAVVDLFVTRPDGRIERFRAASEGNTGEYVSRFRPEHSGVYRVSTEAHDGSVRLGSASTAWLVGDADVEMADPRLNVEVLRRIARTSGGRLVAPGEMAALLTTLSAGIPDSRLPIQRDLWHNGWSFAAVVVLLGTEWVLRRRWGMR